MPLACCAETIREQGVTISVVDLPPPPEGQTGWPWTLIEAVSASRAKSDERWPRISIVTPSLNQGRFIEETIRSVLLQNYPNLEYIVVDGGSTDQTLNVMRKYDRWITHWVSEPDRGQSHALNKGFAFATGDVLAYLNSDDLYEPGALGKIAQCYSENNGFELFVGSCTIFDEDHKQRISNPWWPDTPAYFLQPFGSPFAQPASFWSPAVYRNTGGFNEGLDYIMDREFFLRLALDGVHPHFVSDVVARYRDHPGTKTRQTIRIYQESISVVQQFAAACGLKSQDRRALLKKIRNDIDYLTIFIWWKKYGRWSAILKYALLLMQAPALIADRKLLGLGRRLLTFRKADVLELKNI